MIFAKIMIFIPAYTKKVHLPNLLAVRTGLEPATPGVTGPYSNQLNYRTNIFKNFVGAEGVEPPTLCL